MTPKITWVVEPELWEGHAEAMQQATSVLGHAVYFTDITLQKPLPTIDGPVLVHGSFQLADKVNQEWKIGGRVICTRGNFLWTEYAPKIPGRMMLNSKWVKSTTGELVKMASEQRLEECFVRPNDGGKPFGGTVFAGDRVTWLAYTKMFVREAGEHAEVIMCPLQKISAEYRLIVVLGRVVTASQYMRDDSFEIRPGCPPGAVALAEEAARCYQPDPAFVVDVADTPDGFRVVEMNGFSTSDWYGGDVAAILKAAEQLVSI